MFARTLLVISISCIFSSLSNATNTTTTGTATLEDIPETMSIPIESYPLTAPQTQAENLQPITPAATAVEDAIDDGIDAAAIDSEPVTSELAPPVARAQSNIAETPAVENKTTTQNANDWSLDALNQAEWSNDLERGQFPIYAKTQVLLNRKHASPGAIDGVTGKNTLKALSTYQTMNGLTVDGELTEETWQSLNADQFEPAFIEYSITAEDLKGPYAKSIPSNYAEQAKMKGLYYTRVTEMFGEKFHMDENFLKKLNPKAKFNTVGEKIIVANVRNSLPEDIHLIIAHKGAKQLYLFNSQNKMIASFPATIGSSSTPSPTGTYTIKSVAPNPWYGYNPSNFVQGGNMKPLSLPPGPNNPVGSMWIGLSKPSFGIHGTPNPSLISKTASHGCIRLTNWDANDLASRVQPGITVKFL